MQAQAADLKRVANIPDKVRREFAAMTLNLDDGIGRILNILKQTKLEEDTLVVFMTDHGGTPVFEVCIPLRGNKATLLRRWYQRPCLLRWPGTIPAGKSPTISRGPLILRPHSQTCRHKTPLRSGRPRSFPALAKPGF